MHRGSEYKLEPVSISNYQLICNYLAVLPFEIFGAHGRNLVDGVKQNLRVKFFSSFLIIT